MKIMSVVGARPNLMKIAPFINAIDSHNKKYKPTVNHYLVHTGQHYDADMSDIFFLRSFPASELLKIKFISINTIFSLAFDWVENIRKKVKKKKSTFIKM